MQATSVGLGALSVHCAEPPTGRFAHGVASADPTETSVWLWTRLSDAAGDEPLELEVGLDPELGELVLSAEVLAREADDHCAHVEVRGLAPGQTYYYRFGAGLARSPVGRTRTAPVAGPVRLAFVSCASYAHGYFHAYRHLAERADLAAVVHLGDYVYEYGDGAYGDVRSYDPSHEVVTLEDYRRRYAHYRLDPDLAALHARHPLVVTWDDHELANNAWRGGSVEHEPSTEGPWTDRLEAAARAHREWLARATPYPGSLYRRLSFGETVDLFVLDTRLEGRDAPPEDSGVAAEPGRTLLGAAQRERFLADLRTSGARWKVVAQSVQLSPHHAQFWNHDAWDGYAAERAAILAVLDEEAIEGVIFVCGDGHKSFAEDVTRDAGRYDPATGAGSVAVELMTPAVTSPNLFDDAARELEARIYAGSPTTRFVDAEQRGFWVLSLEDDRARMALTFVAGVDDPHGGEARPGPLFEVRAGERFLREAE